ncbi:DNA polymerase Y family protein [Pseudomonadales bacterium]|nr:DNA polymerase Y family protein [Pseudomonadales bacterium]
MNASNNNSSLWLCLHFPHLPLQVFTRGLNPADAIKPMVILERRRVIALNQAAFDTGIRHNNNMDTAYSISHEVISFDKDNDKELTTLTNLAQWAYQFSPAVTIRAPDVLLIDIGGSLKLFNGLKALMASIECGINDLGYTTISAINATPMAALLSARNNAATNPDYQVTDNTGEVLPSIEMAPVTCLQADQAIINALQQMGIYTLRDLFKLPMSSINRRFGIYFTDYLQRLIGMQPDPQKTIDQAPHFFSDITFMADVTNTNALVFPIKRLLDELNAFLTARQLHINQLSWKLSHRHHPTKYISIYLASPEHNIKALLQLTQLKLEQVKDVQEIDTLSLTVNSFFPADTVSGDLFQSAGYQPHLDPIKGPSRRHQRQASANALLNLLSTRLGPDACFGLSMANDHRPEKSWLRLKPNQISDETQYETAENLAMQLAQDNHRPLFLLTPPRALQLVNDAPYLNGKLELLQGPERIDFGWWDRPTSGEIITRDYYVAAHTERGALYWVFHYSNHGKWYLHGIFS